MILLGVGGGCFVRQMYINNPWYIREQSLALGYIGNTREGGTTCLHVLLKKTSFLSVFDDDKMLLYVCMCYENKILHRN